MNTIEHWQAEFERETGFEPSIGQCEFEDGEITFRQYAERNYDWLDDWVNECRRSLEEKEPEIDEGD